MALIMRDGLDEEAFEALFVRARDPLYAYAAAVTLDAPAAEDVVQKAFELALARRTSFKPELGTPDAWLFGIARHLALDERRRARRCALAGGCSVLGDLGAPDRALERSDHAGALFAALNNVDERQREVVALKFWGDLSNREIGAILGCSESNVGTILHRAIVKLREVCDDLV